MSKAAKGTLIIIGGHEDKEGDQEILNEICKKAMGAGKRLALVTVASMLPEEMADEYIKVFTKLGVPHVDHVDIRIREDAHRDEAVQKILNAAVVFFTG